METTELCQSCATNKVWIQSVISKQQIHVDLCTRRYWCFSFNHKPPWDKSMWKWFPIKVPPGHFEPCTLGLACCYGYRQGWILVMDQSSVDSSSDWQAGWTLISPSMFDRTECKNNTSPSGPYGWFWEDQLLRAFKAVIFISHPHRSILISDEGLVSWR